MKNETDEFRVLMVRVQPLIDGVDLETDITPTIADSIAVGGMSGTPMSVLAKKLFVLKSRREITSEQYRLILADHYDIVQPSVAH